MLEEMLVNIISTGSQGTVPTAFNKKTSPLFEAMSIIGGGGGKYDFLWRGGIGELQPDGTKSGTLIRR